MLLEIVLTLRTAGRFARRLNRRQQEGDQNADDGDHDKQFDQGKAGISACSLRKPTGSAFSMTVTLNEE